MDNESMDSDQGKEPEKDNQVDMGNIRDEARADQRPDAMFNALDGERVLAPEATDMIGSQLRKIYSDLVAEPLPDRFQSLLERLSSSEPRS